MIRARRARRGKTADGLLMRPADARLLYVLAHGAGAGMRHPFLAAMARALAARGVATWRYEFPYMLAGSPRIDPPATLEACVREAVARAREAAPDLPVIAGGKSLGGRMTSRAQAAAPLDGVRALVFLGFPLHPAGRPATTRAEHLAGVDVPMLFLQGTRDALAELPLLEPILARLPRATLHVVDGADHGFHVLKRSGRTDRQVIEELAESVATWGAAHAR
jgi:predicted alpha/beta-hydrolase family hydrolase